MVRTFHNMYIWGGLLEVTNEWVACAFHLSGICDVLTEGFNKRLHICKKSRFQAFCGRGTGHWVPLPSWTHLVGCEELCKMASWMARFISCPSPPLSYPNLSSVSLNIPWWKTLIRYWRFSSLPTPTALGRGSSRWGAQRWICKESTQVQHLVLFPFCLLPYFAKILATLAWMAALTRPFGAPCRPGINYHVIIGLAPCCPLLLQANVKG